MQINKLEFFKSIGYEPHSAGQWSYHMSNARFRVPVCGRRFGKSVMAGKDLEPQLFTREKKRFWIVGPTYDLGEKEFRVIWDDLIVGKQLGSDKRTKKAYNKRSGEMYIEFPWGSRVEVRSAQHPETLVGDALDGVILSEAAKHNIETWERFIRPSLSDRRGWATFPTTPEGRNWLYNLWQFGQDSRVADYDSWKFPSWDNRIIYPGGRDDPEIKLLELTTTPEWFLQEIGADFSSFVGRIYPEFDEVVHVREQKYNPAWQNYIAFDFGFIAPLAAIEFQVDPWDGIHVWREHYIANKDLREHLHILRSRPQPEGYKIDLCFGDAADPEAIAVIGQSFAPCVGDPLSKSNWREGVDLVKRFLIPTQIGEMDEYGTPKLEPKLFVDNSCSNLIREFNNYRAKENLGGVNEHNAAGAAQRQDDHALDALRYGLMHIFTLGCRSHLSEVMSQSDLISTIPEQGYFNEEGMRF